MSGSRMGRENIMKRLIAGSLLALLATFPAHAISRYNSMDMSCAAARDHIAREGAVILRYRSARHPSLTLYDRYVRDGGFCATSLTTEPAYVPTADLRQCFVGYRCVPIVVPNDVPFPRR
jgi:hypothetical protein